MDNWVDEPHPIVAGLSPFAISKVKSKAGDHLFSDTSPLMRCHAAGTVSGTESNFTTPQNRTARNVRIPLWNLGDSKLLTEIAEAFSKSF